MRGLLRVLIGIMLVVVILKAIPLAASVIAGAIGLAVSLVAWILKLALVGLVIVGALYLWKQIKTAT